MKVSRARRRRVSGGAVEVWKDALARAREHWRYLASSSAVVLVVVVALNVFPGIPTYQRGLFTGALFVFLAWTISWFIWVTSGLSLRLNGVWAEESVAQDLRKSPSVLQVIRSFKTDGRDVDVIAITRQGVLVIEVKWSLRSPAERKMEDAAYQVARGCRTLRNQIHVEGLAAHLFRPMVVYCGRDAAMIEPVDRSVQVGSVDSVLVMGVEHLDQWLSSQSGGHISSQFASTMANEIELIAEVREQANVEASWLVRRLARAK